LLFFAHGFVKGNQGPVGFSLGPIATQITSDPEFRAVQVYRALVPVVYLVRIVKFAIVGCCAVVVMGGRFRVEVTLTEHRTTACLNGRRIQRPVGLRRVSGAHGEQRNCERDTPSFQHAQYLLGGKL
jgi:hypothetical protein